MIRRGYMMAAGVLCQRVMDQPEIAPAETAPARSTANQALKWAFLSIGILMLIAIVAFAIPYWKLARRVDRQLAAGPFQHTLSYYAAPVALSTGDRESPQELVAALHRAGLRESSADQQQTFSVMQDSVIVRTAQPVRVDFAGTQVRAITDLSTNKALAQIDLPPQLITNLSDAGRARRIMVRYADLPQVLVNAVVSIEDKRFFTHDGVDVFRIVKAMYVDVKQHRKEQGASTLTMQLARNLWLDRDKRWGRKFSESLITIHLERTLTKQQIFEFYSNQVYLGGIGTFSINGFGEAAKAYFNKDIRNLTLTEAATLAGIVQRPTYFNPLRFPDRVVERRNTVLTLMRENGYITQEQYQQAVASPLGLRPGINELSETQYFLDLASDQVQRGIEDHEGGSAMAYTTLDLRLQRAAELAVRDGMALVDKEVSKSRKKGQAPGTPPQVALIALDPHTGDIKALIGGRDYTSSQLNRILAKRPPGSVFKPFVYTTAINSAVEGGEQTFTPASTILDAPTTFQFDNITYSPGNFRGNFMGQVTLRQALAHSLNVATVKLAEKVGYDRVVALAHRAGLNEDIKATPAVALGAYQVTPLEIAGAYTMFANRGVRVKPNFISTVRTQDGDSLYQHDSQTYPTLDPRVAFIMTDMLEEVMRSGTAAGVRARGFKLPAAGKTGTSHDGWFAGYTSELLCIVWVGYDDYRELGIEGAKSALPIWTEFMMEAARYKEFREAKQFTAPAGVVKAATCGGPPDYFIEGSQPPPCPPPATEFFPAGEADRTIPPGNEQVPQPVQVDMQRREPKPQAPPQSAPSPQPRGESPVRAEQAAMPVRTPTAVAPPMPVKTPMPVRTAQPVQAPAPPKPAPPKALPPVIPDN